MLSKTKIKFLILIALMMYKFSDYLCIKKNFLFTSKTLTSLGVIYIIANISEGFSTLPSKIFSKLMTLQLIVQAFKLN